MSPSASQSPSHSASPSASPSHSTSPSSSASPSSAITTPSDLADIWEWWEPSREGFSDNDSIGTLNGQFASGIGHDWEQSSSSLKPTYKAGIVNGLGIARFDGTDDEMSSVNPTALTAVHLFAVVKMDSNTPAAGKSGLWSFGTVGNSYPKSDVPTDISNDSFRGSSPSFSKLGIDVSQWRVVEIVATSSEWTFKLDGTVLKTDGTALSHQVAAFIRLGRDGPSGLNYMDGDFAGMYLMSAKLSSGERASMVDYLNSRFALSIT